MYGYAQFRMWSRDGLRGQIVVYGRVNEVKCGLGNGQSGQIMVLDGLQKVRL